MTYLYLHLVWAKDFLQEVNYLQKETTPLSSLSFNLLISFIPFGDLYTFHIFSGTPPENLFSQNSSYDMYMYSIRGFFKMPNEGTFATNAEVRGFKT